MQVFTDNAGRAWTITLTIDSAKRVRGLLDVNLLELEAGDPPLLTRLATDVILLCDAIYVLVKPQADTLGVTDEQFGAALGGEAILAAQKAFYEELVVFFQQTGRTDLMQAITAQRRMIDMAVMRITTQIERLDLEAMCNDSIPGESSMSAPGSLASTPEH